MAEVGIDKPVRQPEQQVPLESAGNLERYVEMKRLFDDVIDHFPDVPIGRWERFEERSRKNMIVAVKSNRFSPQNPPSDTLYIFEKNSKGWIKYHIEEERNSQAKDPNYSIEVSQSKSPYILETPRTPIHYKIGKGPSGQYLECSIRFTDKDIKDIKRSDLWAIDVSIDRGGKIHVSGGFLFRLEEKEWADDMANKIVVVRKTNDGYLHIQFKSKTISVPTEPNIQAMRRATEKVIK